MDSEINDKPDQAAHYHSSSDYHANSWKRITEAFPAAVRPVVREPTTRSDSTDQRANQHIGDATWLMAPDDRIALRSVDGGT